MQDTTYNSGGCSNGVRGVATGGSPGYKTRIDYVTISIASNALDFGELSVNRLSHQSCSDGVRGTSGLGHLPPTTESVEYLTIGTLGASVDYAELTQARSEIVICFSGD